MTRIVLLCATRRGYRFLEKLAELAPRAELVVCSFAEDPWEPPYLADIRRLAGQVQAEFHEVKQVGRLMDLWEEKPFDLMLAVSWRYIVPAAVYERARLGAFVFHDSPLPAYRGFAPTVWAMINGEEQTGVTLLEMVDDYDAGDVVGQSLVPIGDDETIATVLQRVSDTYLDLLATHLPALLAGTATRTPQRESDATYTVKLQPQDFRIDWQASTDRVYDLIRAATAPYPGAWTVHRGKRLRIWSARRLSSGRRWVGRIPGRVAEIRVDGAVVLTGDGAVLVREVQVEDGRRQDAPAVLRRITDTLGE